jgi:TatD DNase family protein
MNLPRHGDYIDIHTHGGTASPGIFILESLIAGEGKSPEDIPDQACTFGIHPWYLNENNSDLLLEQVKTAVLSSNLLAVGEAGFDKLKGPSFELQRKVFEEQLKISETYSKPLVIHCVRAWDELLASHKKYHPEMPWLIHGFRGSRELAEQLLSKGMYISFWFDFIIRPESAALVKSLPGNSFFLETDGADIDIRDIYTKVAADLDLTVDELKSVILGNFNRVFVPGHT